VLFLASNELGKALFLGFAQKQQFWASRKSAFSRARLLTNKGVFVSQQSLEKAVLEKALFLARARKSTLRTCLLYKRLGVSSSRAIRLHPNKTQRHKDTYPRRHNGHTQEDTKTQWTYPKKTQMDIATPRRHKDTMDIPQEETNKDTMDIPQKDTMDIAQEDKFGLLVSELVVWLGGLFVGWLVGWLGGWFVAWLVGWLVGWSVGRSVGRSVGLVGLFLLICSC